MHGWSETLSYDIWCMICDKNINAKSFTHSFFKRCPEVRSQYFSLLTEVNINENTRWRKIKKMLLVSRRWDKTKKKEWKPKIVINLILIPGVAWNCFHQSCPDYISWCDWVPHSLHNNDLDDDDNQDEMRLSPRLNQHASGVVLGVTQIINGLYNPVRWSNVKIQVEKTSML